MSDVTDHQSEPEDRVSVLENMMAALVGTVTDLAQGQNDLKETLTAALTPPDVVPQDIAPQPGVPPGTARFQALAKDYKIVMQPGSRLIDETGRLVNFPQKEIHFSMGIYDTRDAEEIEFLRTAVDASTRQPLLGREYIENNFARPHPGPTVITGGSAAGRKAEPQPSGELVARL